VCSQGFEMQRDQDPWLERGQETAKRQE